MAYLYEHEADCQRLLGNPWTKVHRWLDGLVREHGPYHHRQYRHHAEGIEEVRAMWGDEAATAAKIHIIVDCWGIPTKEDYENEFVNHFGFRPDATEEEGRTMLQAVGGPV